MASHLSGGAAELEKVLRAIRRRRRISAALYGFFAVAASLLFSLSLAVAGEAAVRGDPPVRLAFWAVVLIVGGAVGAFAVRAGRGSVGRMERIAADVERMYPEFRERLIAGWEFSTRDVPGSRALAEAVVQEAAELLAGSDIRRLVNWRGFFRSFALTLVGALLLAGMLRFSPNTFGPAFARLLSPTVRFGSPRRIVFSVEPGNTRLARGDTLTVRVGIAGERPARVTMRSRDLQTQVWRRDIVTVPETGRLTWRWPQVRGDIEYQVTAGEFRSPVYRVAVVERPNVRSLNVVLNYPRYTGLKPDVLGENEGDVSALVGTEISLSVRANKAVAEGSVVFSRGDTLPLRRSGDGLTGSWRIVRNRDYHVHLVDEFGYENKNPISYHVRAIKDAYPSVRIAEPERETDLGQDMLVGLRVEAMDDYGFDRLELRYQAPGGGEKAIALPLTLLGPGEAQSQYIWDVGGFDLLPEDRITYRAVVYDNDRIRGPKRAETDEYTLRFPSVMEVFAEANEQQQEQIGSLTELVRRGRETQQRLDALRRELLKTEDLSWESRQEAQRIAERQREMSGQVERVAEQLKSTLEQLQKHDVLSPETLDKMLQIREMMSQIVTPELRKALGDMQESVRRMLRPEQIQEAMNRLSERHQEFDKKLDRLLNLLKAAQADQRLDAMSKRLQELARLQEKVVESFLRERPQALADREKTLGEQVSEAERKLEKMAREMRDLKASPSDSLRRVADLLDRSRIAERLDRLGAALRSLDSGSRNGMRESHMPEAQALRDALDRAAQTMRNTAKMRRSAQRQDITQKLDRAANDFLRLSMMQEQVRKATASGSAGAQPAPVGEEQVDLQQAASSVVGRVMDAARETFLVQPDLLKAMGDALTNMQGATSALEQKNPGMAEPRQREAMAALNDAVRRLRSASKAAQSGESGAGLEQLLRQLSRMAENQRRLNEMADQMGGQGSLSPSDLQVLAEMAAQQQALSEAMRRLSEELMRYRQTIGRLGNLAGEMEQAAEQMRQGKLGPRLQDRQRRILQRLLDAQRSLNQGRQSRERVSQTARDYVPRKPGALPADRGERRIFLQEALIEALKANYPPEYRAWIRHYYGELLRQDMPAGSERVAPERH